MIQLITKNGISTPGIEPTTFALLARRSNQLSYLGLNDGQKEILRILFIQ